MLIELEPLDEFRSPRPTVLCKDGKWRTSEEMMRDGSYAECELCGDEIRRLRGQAILQGLVGINAEAGKNRSGPNRRPRFRIYCCQECANIAMEDRDAKIYW